MAIGYGPGKDMVKSVNSARAKSKKRSLKRSSEMTMGDGKNSSALKYKSTSPEQMAEVQAMIAKDKKRKLIINLVLYGILGLVVLYILLFVDVISVG